MRQESLTTCSSCTSTGTSFWPENSIASFSVKRHGTVLADSPLWASAMCVFQQCGLKRSVSSAPARSYRVRSGVKMPCSFEVGSIAEPAARILLSGGAENVAREWKAQIRKHK
ncbi:hypothetical protein D3C72_1866790 [compost metagenome]